MAKEGIFYSSDSLCIFMIVTFVKEVALLNNSHKENNKGRVTRSEVTLSSK